MNVKNVEGKESVNMENTNINVKNEGRESANMENRRTNE